MRFESSLECSYFWISSDEWDTAEQKLFDINRNVYIWQTWTKVKSFVHGYTFSILNSFN